MSYPDGHQPLRSGACSITPEGARLVDRSRKHGHDYVIGMHGEVLTARDITATWREVGMERRRREEHEADAA
jgi:hypothetical protein